MSGKHLLVLLVHQNHSANTLYGAINWLFIIKDQNAANRRTVMYTFVHVETGNCLKTACLVVELRQAKLKDKQ